MPTRSVQDGQLRTSSVDYLTATGKTPASQFDLQYIGRALLRDARGDGNVERDWSAHGYTGVAVAGVSVGTSNDSTILRISGARASDVCGQIITMADNITRIDLQTTVGFRRDVSALARHHASELRRVQRGRVRPISARLERTFGRGDTLYVGSRASNYFGRIYDKYKESKDDAYRKCWRYEIECKGDGAAVAAKFLNSVDFDQTTIEMRVHGWFAKHGIKPAWKPVASAQLGTVGRPPTDAERRLIWLSRQVAPSIEWLQWWYDRADIERVLFDGVSPADIEPRRWEETSEMPAFDSWVIQGKGEARVEGARQLHEE